MTTFSRSAERAEDEIAEGSSDAAAQRNALLWKLNAIPTAYLATEHPDPLAMLVDLWALCLQQTMYFESGAGTDLFGTQQGLAIRASGELHVRSTVPPRKFSNRTLWARLDDQRMS